MRKLAFWLMAPVATDEDAKDQARAWVVARWPLVIEWRGDR